MLTIAKTVVIFWLLSIDMGNVGHVAKKSPRGLRIPKSKNCKRVRILGFKYKRQDSCIPKGNVQLILQIIFTKQWYSYKV